MKMLKLLLAVPALLLVPVAGPAQQPSLQAQSEAARLHALFKESDEASLRRNPIEALYRGDLRYAAQFGDYVTPAY